MNPGAAVLARSGIPAVNDFANATGTPIVINTDNGDAYALINEVPTLLCSSSYVPLPSSTITVESKGGGITKTAAQNDAAIALAAAALPSRGGEVRFNSVGKYSISSVMSFIDKRNFFLSGVAPGDSGGADVGSRISWDGAAGGTMCLLDACRDFVVQNLQLASGAASYGVGFDWDKISGTGTSTNGMFQNVMTYIPSAGIGWRVSNIADANHEAGKWFNCYAIGPGTALAGGLSPGTGGTSIGVQIRGMNAHALMWLGGGTSLLNVTFDVNDNIATKLFPGGSINVIQNNGGYCDIYYQVGKFTRWPIEISGGSVEFANQLFASTDANNSEAGVVTIENLRCAVPTSLVTPYIRYRNQGILNLTGNNFNANGYEAAFQIKLGVGGGGVETGLVSRANVYPNLTPWDTSAGRNFSIDSAGDKGNDGLGTSDAVAMPTLIGGYGSIAATNRLQALKIYTGTDAGAFQTATGTYAGTGAPNNANGNNGDFYFRSDGGALTAIYQRRAGAWVGII